MNVLSMMNSTNPFLKTLKRLGYSEADSLDDSDFDSIISEKELKSFFEVFCMLNEKNVLTTEEIEEYSALTPAELAEIEILEKNGKLEKCVIEYEKKKEILFLQEQLAHIENHNKSIERQLEDFKKFEKDLLEEKEIQQNVLLDAKKMFQTYEMNKVPQAEEKLVLSLKSIIEVAQDLEFLIVHSDARDNKLPTSNFFKDKVQQYLSAEGKILQCITTYLLNNFQMQENDTLSFIVDENHHRKELRKEAAFLQKTLKSSMMDKAISENEAQKIESIVKYFETVRTSNLNCHSSQLRYKLKDALKLNEQLKEKEGELTAYVHSTVSKYVDAFLAEVDVCVNNETLNTFQFCIEKMSLPMNILLCQRARVELLIASLGEHKTELGNLKKLIGKVLNQIEQEKSYLQERKILIQNEMIDDTQKKDEEFLETVILPSLNKILAIPEDYGVSDSSKVCIKDVVEKANKFFEAKENSEKKHEEKIKIIESVEKYALSMESLLNCTNENFSDWHELEQTINTNLNIVNMKLASLEENIAECNQDLEQKQKLLERKGNLCLARNLFVYALMNKELFKKCIDDIKVAVENSEG